MLRAYERGEHKGGFIGVRVAVMVDGKHRQRYFSYKDLDKSPELIFKEAKQLHQEWLMEKDLAGSKNKMQSKELRRTTSPYSTGIKGIKFKINHKRASFLIQGSTDNKLFNKSFSINDLGYDLAWFKACEFLQSKKGYALFDIIYKKKPPKEMLLITFRYTFFSTKNKVSFESISSIIDKATFISWIKQLKRQYPDNKLLKENIFEYVNENKIYDEALY